MECLVCSEKQKRDDMLFDVAEHYFDICLECYLYKRVEKMDFKNTIMIY